MSAEARSAKSGGAPAELRRAKTVLQALSFFMADMQAGIAPFLQQRGLTTGPIGSVMLGIASGGNGRAIGIWPDQGLTGTQFGQNKNGKHW